MGDNAARDWIKRRLEWGIGRLVSFPAAASFDFVFSLEFGLEKAGQGVVSHDSRETFAEHREELMMRADIEVESSGVFKGHPVSVLLCMWGLSLMGNLMPCQLMVCRVLCAVVVF